MDQPNYPCDLHMHSVRSDGNDTVHELIDNAAALGMKAIALTDHDVRPPETIEVDGTPVSPREYARRKGLCFIPGIEYSCDTYVDDVHIVGLGCDFAHSALADIEEAMEKSKMDGYRKLTEVLCENGIHVTWNDVLAGGGGRRPEEVQRKHIFETIAVKGYCGSWQEAKLLVRDNPKFNVRREKVDPIDAIHAIHAAGGVAILAHPHLIDAHIHTEDGRDMSRDAYVDGLISAGLDGIEAAYTYDKTSYKGSLSKQQIEREVREKYEPRLSVISGGSDYHADGKKGVQNPRMIGEAGVTFEYFRENPVLKRFL